MKGELARVAPGDLLYDEQDDTELEIVGVFPERGVVQVAADDETEFRDLVETLAAIRAGRLVRVADGDEEADSDGDDSDDADDQDSRE